MITGFVYMLISHAWQYLHGANQIPNRQSRDLLRNFWRWARKENESLVFTIRVFFLGSGQSIGSIPAL